jgi:NAD(P)-dependent dehydrogenase (short-subunit alcohol dehydrogenase family)
MALACAAHGATVVLLGRTEAKLEQVYDVIEAAGHPRPALVPVNLETATFQEYTQLAGYLEQELGRLDGLLHNAASLGILSPVAHYNPELWLRTVQVDLHAPFLLTRACLPLLIHAPDASVVFVSDAVGRRGKAYWGAYAVAKAGLERLMEVLADELENSPVRVNSLDPGRLRTLLRARAYPGENPNTVPAPETAVAALLYLIGPDSQTLRGRALTL